MGGKVVQIANGELVVPTVFRADPKPRLDLKESEAMVANAALEEKN